MKDIRQKLLATFQIEHRDHVEQIRSLLAMMEQTTGELGSPELDEAFRRAHSLKGAARIVDLQPVERLAQRLETLLSRVRQGVLRLDKDTTGVVHKVLDASEDCVNGSGGSSTSQGFESALQAIERVLGIEPQAAKAAEPKAPVSVPVFQPLDTVRVTAQNFNGLLLSAAELLAESHRQERALDQLNGLTGLIADIEREGVRVRRTAARSLRKLRSEREFSQVSSFLDSLEHQTRALSRQASAMHRYQQHTSWTMRRLGQQLQRDVWQARMLPAESLLEGYRKMMRDLAQAESKEIEFRTVSTAVHADRGVLEALRDPLMHMLRNALSHGIETPAERTLKGKPPAGVVTLRIDTKGQYLTIAVEDDGRGVDLKRVAEVAASQGIFSAADAASRPPQELRRVLFQPGFSTSKSVNDLSGRGMGLSVVYEAVRRLRGEVDVKPRDGCGTAFHLSVPLSISMQKLLLVSCGGEPFAIAMHAVERLHRMKSKSVETLEGKPVIVLDGVPVPLFGLRQLLNLDDTPASTDQEALRVMILRFSGGRAAIAVDRFLRETDAVIQDLGAAKPPLGKISGGIILEDGTVALVLNSVGLMENSVHQVFRSAAEPVEAAPDRARASIMVVDDSITTRTLERSILEAHGYRVRVAVDGLEALAQLRAEKADLVITDIQMPGMDGFALLETLKKDPTLGAIPVIVVTSMECREDQERGLALGADAYIVKRKFDQGELLAAIRQIL